MNKVKTITGSFPGGLAFAFMLALLAVVPRSIHAQQADTIRMHLEAADNVYAGFWYYSSVWVECGDNCEQLNRFDLLIDCGSMASALDSVALGVEIEGAGWEYFSYEMLYDSLLHIELAADLPEIPGEPYHFYGEGELLNLRFLIPDDSTTDCAFFPLKFYWFWCDDNIIETTNGDTVFVSEQVYDWAGVGEGHVPFPDPSGIPSHRGTPDWCLDYISPDAEVTRYLEFYNGGFQIHCSDSLYPGDRGDINVNGQANEIADYILFESYFLYGIEVFVWDLERQIARSDVNCDGVVLAFRDLVYIWRIIVGDALPCVEPAFDTSETVWFVQDTISNTLRVHCGDVGLAGAHLIFSDSVLPAILIPDFEVRFHYDADSNLTRVLIPPDSEFPFTTLGTGALLSIDGPGQLVEAYTTDYFDSEIPTMIVIGGADIDLVIGLIQYIFAGGPLPEPVELADADCSGYVDIDDVVWVIEYIFMGGPAPGDC